MARRFFVEGTHEADERVQLDGSDAHKIVSVLRLRTGDAVEIIDSAGSRFAANVEIDGRAVAARLTERLAVPDACGPRITVAQGVPKGQKMDFVVEKLTELGVARIVPLQSERTVVADVSPAKLERWRRLARAAGQQCGRSDVPAISQPASLEDLIGEFVQFHTVLMPWELASAAPLRETLPALIENAGTVLVLIGPEGGFTHAEADAAHAAGAHLISLGARILRTETAAMALLSMLWYAYGV